MNVEIHLVVVAFVVNTVAVLKELMVLVNTLWEEKYVVAKRNSMSTTVFYHCEYNMCVAIVENGN